LRRVKPFPLLKRGTGQQDHQPIAERLPQHADADRAETSYAAPGRLEFAATGIRPLLPDPFSGGRQRVAIRWYR
jgi:hypothetical protein